MSPSQEPLLVVRDSSSLELKFNRPDRANSLSPDLLEKFESELEQAAHDKSLKMVWITGVGERFFSAGADVGTLFDDPQGLSKILQGFSRVLKRLQTMPILVAARINGDCVGGGLGIALACDYLLAAEHARFGTPEITGGIFPYVIAPTLVERIGTFQARALCFGGRLWTAEQAFQRGLVSEVVVSADVNARTEALRNLWERVDPKVLIRGKMALHDKPLPSKKLVEYLKESVEQAKVQSTIRKPRGSLRRQQPPYKPY